MRTLILGLAVVGSACGGARPSVVAAPVGVRMPDGAHVGCSPVDSDDEEAHDALMLRRTAERLEIEVPEAEVERALEHVRRENELTEEQLRAALEQRGFTLATYQREVRGQLLRRRVAYEVAGPGRAITDAALQRAYVAEYGDDPDENPEAASLLRARLRERLERERVDDAVETTMQRLREYWDAVAVEEDERCVERPPTVVAQDVMIVGNAALTASDIWEILAADGDPIELAPANTLPPATIARLQARLYDRGRLSAVIEPLQRDGDRWLLQLHEGPVYRLREVFLVREDHGGERHPADPTLLEGISFAIGEIFERSSIAESIEVLSARANELLDEGVELRPETVLDPDRGLVALTIVIAPATP